MAYHGQFSYAPHTDVVREQLPSYRSLTLSDCQLDATSSLSRLTCLTNLDALELHRCQPQGSSTALMAIVGSLTGAPLIYK